MVLHALDPDFAVELVHRQAADLKNPPHSVKDVLDLLAVIVPTFAAIIRDGL